MMKILLLILFLFSALALSAQQPAQVKDLEKKRSAIMEDIEATNQLLNENKKTTGNALYRLNLLTQQIHSRKEVILLLNKEIESIDVDIRFKEMIIQNLERELNLKKGNYAESLKKMYSHKNNQDQLLFVLSADDFAQSYRRIMYLKEYSNWQKKKSEEIIVKQRKLEIEKSLLLKSKTEKLALANERKQEEVKLVLQEESKKEEIEFLQKKKKDIQAELNKKRRQAEAINREIDRVIAAEIARVQREARIAAEAKALAEKNAAEKAAKEQANKSTKKTKKKKKTEMPVEEVAVSAPKSKEEFVVAKEEVLLSSNFENNKGSLPFPVRGNRRIVGRAGIQYHPDLKDIKQNNFGLVIQTTSGNTVHSIFDGEVTTVSINPQLYNTLVFIRHGNYFSIYSNLGEIYVKKGDRVKTGQAIGKIFTDTEKGEGSILEFGITKGQVKLNPESWLAR